MYDLIAHHGARSAALFLLSMLFLIAWVCVREARKEERDVH